MISGAMRASDTDVLRPRLIKVSAIPTKPLFCDQHLLFSCLTHSLDSETSLSRFINQDSGITFELITEADSPQAAETPCSR